MDSPIIWLTSQIQGMALLYDMTIPKYWKQATEELAKNDPVMAKIIGQYRGEFLQSRGDAFFSLARSIVGQQISVKAAASVWQKLESAVGGVSEKIIHAAEEDIMRSAGLSRQKASYMKSLAQHFVEGLVDVTTFPDKSDEEIIKELTKIKGIGRWTAEMFLIFHMLRPDVFPVDDIGLQKAVEKHYKKPSPRGRERITKKEMLNIAKKWQPWRSVATWYMWRSLDPLPVEY